MNRRRTASGLPGLVLSCVLFLSPLGVDAFCGDGECQDYENPDICPADCGFGEGGGNEGCGDGLCDTLFGGETPETCPEDCSLDGCGDQICFSLGGETAQNCPMDCPETCNDFMCQPWEEGGICPIDCGGCGDFFCDAMIGEDPLTCDLDCGGAGNKACGDGICDQETESIDSCPIDCGKSCGDGNCSPDEGESCDTCVTDCGECPFCGDGICNEDPFVCPEDCVVCGDDSCDSLLGEDCEQCPADCGACPFCGDEQCNAEEDCLSCATDCGECVCGDDACSFGETPDNCPSDCGMANCSMTITLYSGSYGNEVSWLLKNSTDDLLCSGPGDTPYQSANNYSLQCDISGGPSYTFFCEDSFGDGWNGAYISISNEEGTQAGPFTFDSGNSASFPFTLKCPSPPECGDGTCNGEETSDSCLEDCPLPYCGDQFCNGEEGCEDCAVDCGVCSCTLICTMFVTTYGNEISWYINDSGGASIANGPQEDESYSNWSDYPYTLPDTLAGAYTLYMEDSWGDGWGGSDLVCGLEDGTELLSTTLSSGTSGSEDFSVICPPPDEIPGCTDPGAPNYNPEANTDDGSCLAYCGDDVCEDTDAENCKSCATDCDTCPCPPGTSSEDGADACTPCPAGTFSPIEGASECLPCQDGMTSEPGASFCYVDLCIGVVCPAPSPCHNEGFCDPTSGQCLISPKEDGIECEDGNLCTSSDKCLGGTCVPGVQITCENDGNPCTSETCNPETGKCHENVTIGNHCVDGEWINYCGSSSGLSFPSGTATLDYDTSLPVHGYQFNIQGDVVGNFEVTGVEGPFSENTIEDTDGGQSISGSNPDGSSVILGNGDLAWIAFEPSPEDRFFGGTLTTKLDVSEFDTSMVLYDTSCEVEPLLIPGCSDADADAICDVNDNCPNDPAKSEPGTCECGIPDTDSDGDQVFDCEDLCPNDPSKIDPGICDCGTPDEDSDGDGTADCDDLCPNDPLKIAPGICGCGISDIDNDGDQVPDCFDLCPNDPFKIDPGICGCEVPDGDSDGDGTADCDDDCPDNPDKTDPGICGCEVPDEDSDGDGTADCDDLCPNDPLKIAPGICGCGISDIDNDGDQVPDCFDLCPNDPFKIDPGICGCGAPDEDSDGNGVADCLCGDGVCESDGEDCSSCPSDCGCVSDDSCEVAVCDDGICGTSSPILDPHAGCKGSKALMSDGKCCNIHVGPRTPILTEDGFNGHCVAGPTTNVFFVSPPPTGSDIDGDGSSDGPFATIQKAVDVAEAYDIVCVDKGEYNAGANIDLPLTILGSGALPPTQSLINGGQFRIQSTHYVDIQFLAIVESDGGGAPVPAVQVIQANFVSLLDLLIVRAGNAGVEVLNTPKPPPSSFCDQDGFCDDVEGEGEGEDCESCPQDCGECPLLCDSAIRHNFEGCYLEITSSMKSSTGNGSGILTQLAQDVLVSLSKIHDNAGPGLTLILDDATVSGNVIENNNIGVVISDPIENLNILQNDVNNNEGAGVLMSQEGTNAISAQVSGNSMASNGGEAVAAFNGNENLFQLDLVIHGNEFTDHESATIFTVRTPVTLTDNVIVGTTATTENTLASGRAVEIQRPPTLTVESNMIENSEGGAIFVLLTELTETGSIADNLLFDPGLYAISLQGLLAADFQCNIPGAAVDLSQTIQVTENTIEDAVGAGVVLESIHQPVNFVNNEIKDTKLLSVLDEAGDPETIGYEVSACAAPFRVTSNLFDSPLPLDAQVSVQQALSIAGLDSVIGPDNTYSAASPEVGFFDPEGNVSILDPGVTPIDLISCPTPCPIIPQDAQKTKDAVDNALP